MITSSHDRHVLSFLRLSKVRVRELQRFRVEMISDKAGSGDSISTNFQTMVGTGTSSLAMVGSNAQGSDCAERDWSSKLQQPLGLKFSRHKMLNREKDASSAREL